MYSWGLSGVAEATDCFNRVYFGLFHQCNTIYKMKYCWENNLAKHTESILAKLVLAI